jgi:hypothetical protein
VLQEVPQEVPQEVLQEVPQEVPQEVLQEVPQEVPQEIAPKKSKGDFRKKSNATGDSASVISGLSTTSSKRIKKVFTMNGKFVR